MNHKTLIQEIFSYYSHPSSPLITSIWESYLTKHLTIEEMQQATYSIITEERFFPTPQQIVEKVKGNPKQEGLKIWYELLACEGNYRSFDNNVRKILTKIGHVHLMNKSQLTQAKRDFLELFALNMANMNTQTKLPEATNNIPLNPRAIETVNRFTKSFGN